MRYAIIKTGGKQYKVSEGDMLQVELLHDIAPQGEVVFDEVMLSVGDGEIKVGKPYLTDVLVKGILQDEIARGPKIRVMKYKAKVRHRRATGHRQKLSQVLIKSIGEAKKTGQKGSIKEPVKSKKVTAKKAA